MFTVEGWELRVEGLLPSGGPMVRLLRAKATPVEVGFKD